MKKEYVYAGISIFFWSSLATVTKLLLGSLNSMEILLVSSLFAFLFLLLVNVIKGNLKELKQYAFTDYIQMFGVGALGIFLYHLFLYMGIDAMEASQAFIINYLWPIMSVLFACIILKEKMTIRKLAAILLSFLGVIVVASDGHLLQMGKSSLVGALYCILAAVSYGLFTVLNKKNHYNQYVSMMLYYLASTLISLVYVVLAKDSFTLSLPQTLGMLWIGIFTTAIAFTTWGLALKQGDTAKISNLAYITPFLSLVWTFFILKEKLNLYSIAGLLIIVLGIFIQLKGNSKEKDKQS